MATKIQLILGDLVRRVDLSGLGGKPGVKKQPRSQAVTLNRRRHGRGKS